MNSKKIHDLIMTSVAMSSHRQLVDTLKEEIVTYENASNKKDAFRRLAVVCSLILSKDIAPNEEAAKEQVKSFDEFLSIKDLLDQNVN